MRKLALLSVFLALPFRAQSPPDRYTAQAATTAYTIQAPASNGRLIVFGSPTTAGASVYCAAPQTATLSWNGTAATTTTSATEVKLPGTQAPSGMTFWTASNAGSGTTGPAYNIAAGGTLLIDLYNFRLAMNGTGNNLTISTTGSCTITYYYSAA
jgi:hypothetical protein